MYRSILGAGARVGGMIALIRIGFAQIPLPSSEPRIDVILALDNSGSMANNDPRFLLRTAVSSFAETLHAGDHAGVVIFGDGSRLVLPLKAREDAGFGQSLADSLKNLTYKEPYTDIPGGFATSLLELKKSGRASAHRTIVLVTDGVVDLRDRAQIAARKQWLQQFLSHEAEGAEVRVFGIAFTSTADLQLVQSLADATGGDYRRADTAADLGKALEELREQMAKPPPRSKQPATAPTQSSQPQSPPPPQPKTWQWIVAAVLLCAAVAIAVKLLGSIRRNRAADTIPEEQRGFLRPCTGDGKIIEIAHTRTLVGRENTSDIALEEPSVSQPHASIEFRDGGFYLRDLRSRNGTFVHRVDRADSHRVDPREPEPLKHEDIIRFGRVASFIFETETGGGTFFDNGTKVMPAACFYHSALPPKGFCRDCNKALCADCILRHACEKARPVTAE